MKETSNTSRTIIWTIAFIIIFGMLWVVSRKQEQIKQIEPSEVITNTSPIYPSQGKE